MPAAAREIVSAGGTTAGLFMIRQATPIRTVITSLGFVWQASDAAEGRDQIVFLSL
jgi:hypothetical protein